MTTLLTAYNQGYDAATHGKDFDDNPYEIGTMAYGRWQSGWNHWANWQDDDDMAPPVTQWEAMLALI